jgi:hypothetical protein
VKNKVFDWDHYFSSASFQQIRELSPELSTRRLPSVYSPDRQLLYLTSLDIDVQTNNVKELLSALDGVRNSYFSIKSAGSCNGKDAIARTDFIEICSLLANLSEDPDEYLDPDALLAITSSTDV